MIGLLVRPLTTSATNFLAHCAPAIGLLTICKTCQEHSCLGAFAGSFCPDMPLDVLLACSATSLSLFKCHFLRETSFNHLILSCKPLCSHLPASKPLSLLYFSTQYLLPLTNSVFLLICLFFVSPMVWGQVCWSVLFMLYSLYLEMPGTVRSVFLNSFLLLLPASGVFANISSNYSPPRKSLIL